MDAMRRRLAIMEVCAAALLLCSACDSPMPDGDAGGADVDAGVADSGPRLGVDAGPDFDGGTLVDAGQADTDSDGVPDAVDCDPADDTVGTSASRACSGPCGSGDETCSDGVWAACDAPEDCVCDEEGAARVATCGMCGEQSQMCVGGMWEAQSQCLNQGECVPATVEDRMDDMCGHDQRICQATCEWGEWSVLQSPGECRAGMRGFCAVGAPSTDYICTEECTRIDDPDCQVVVP